MTTVSLYESPEMREVTIETEGAILSGSPKLDDLTYEDIPWNE